MLRVLINCNFAGIVICFSNSLPVYRLLPWWWRYSWLFSFFTLVQTQIIYSCMNNFFPFFLFLFPLQKRNYLLSFRMAQLQLLAVYQYLIVLLEVKLVLDPWWTRPVLLLCLLGASTWKKCMLRFISVLYMSTLKFLCSLFNVIYVISYWIMY